MTAVPLRKRSARAELNDLVLQRALVSTVAESGWDATTVAGIARRAGLSATAVYARAESLAEFANDVWTHVLGPVVDDHVVALLAGIGSGDADAMVAEFRRWESPTPELAAALELMTASLFDDELAEVVGEHCRRVLGDACGSSAPALAAVRAMVLSVAIALSLGLRGSVAGSDPALQYAHVVAGFDPDDVMVSPAPLTSAPVVEWTKPVHEDDPYLAAVLPATIAVLGERGFRRATVARICRRAAVSSGAVFGRFSDKSQLVAAAARRMLLTPEEMDDPLQALRREHTNSDAQAIWMRELVRPQHRALWALRLDLARVARHESALADFTAITDRGPYFGVMLLASFVDDLHLLPYEAVFPKVLHVTPGTPSR